MKHLRNLLSQKLDKLILKIERGLNRIKYRTPTIGSVWVDRYAYDTPEINDIETSDPFLLLTVDHVTRFRVIFKTLHIDHETGVLTKRERAVNKYEVLGDEDYVARYRRIYEPSKLRKSIWTKLLRRG